MSNKSKKKKVETQKQKLKAPAVKARKRQADFVTVKAKPGRHLPVGTNVTNTSFAHKQIIVPETKFKKYQEDMTFEEMLRILRPENPEGFTLLEKITSYVKHNRGEVPRESILQRASNFLFEKKARPREKAMRLILLCCHQLTVEQLSGIFRKTALSLCSMMTYESFYVNQDSLTLINELCEIHPSLLGNYPEILDRLLGMISSVHPVTKVRRVKDLIHSSITGDHWRYLVLKSMLNVLKGCWTVADEFEDTEDTQDPSEMMLIPKPPNYSSDSEKLESRNTELMKFLVNAVPVFHDALTANLSSIRTGLDKEAKLEVQTLLEIFCLAGDWIRLPCHMNLKKEIEDLNRFFLKLVKQVLCYFPLRVNHLEIDYKINLSICYLYGLVLEDSGTSFLRNENRIIKYLSNPITASSRMPEDCVSLFLRFIRLVFFSDKLSLDSKESILFGVLNMKDKSEKVVPFFMNLTMNLDHEPISNATGFQTWFSSIVMTLLDSIRSDGLNPASYDSLKYIQRICAKQDPHFLSALNKIPLEQLKVDLIHEDAQFTFTVCVLIANRQDLDAEGLQDLAEVIQSRQLSIRTSRALIAQLNYRFKRDDVPLLEKLEFVKVLLNLACDVFPVIYRTEIEKDMNPSQQKVVHQFSGKQDVLQFRIVPIRPWDSHCELFDVCYTYLLDYLENKAIANGVVCFMKEFLKEAAGYETIENDKVYVPQIPVHSALAVLKILDLTKDIYDEDLMGHRYELIFSLLFYTSIVMRTVKEDDCLSIYSIEEVQKTLLANLEEKHVFFVLMMNYFQDFKLTDVPSAIRVTCFLVRECMKDGFTEHERDALLSLLRIMEACCQAPVLRLDFAGLCRMCGYPV